MSIVDKVIEAVTPPESDEARREATEKARSHATPGDWLSQILDHHEMIAEQFTVTKQATSPEEQRRAERQLATLLTAHSVAEEAAIYPLIAAIGDTGRSTLAYAQQSAAKMQIGLLERLEPMSEDYLDKLGHIEGAVLHHVYEEEGTWFINIIEQAPPEDQAHATQRYREEFDRYMGGDEFGVGSNAGMRAPLTTGSAAGPDVSTSASSGIGRADFE